MASGQSVVAAHGIHHIGINVPDIAGATDFLVNVLGFEEFALNGPFRFDDDWMTRHIDVDRRASVTQVKLFRGSGGCVLEVFQYSAPDQSAARPRNSDLAGHHIAIAVDDIDDAIARLQARGVEVFEKIAGTDGRGGNCYFKAPWGLYLELVGEPSVA